MMFNRIRAALSGGNLTLWLGGAILIGLILALTYCGGRKDGRLASEVEQGQIEREVLERGSAAAERASEARVQDARREAEQRKELEDASKDCDAVGGDCAVRRGCAILRQQGADTSGIAACRRLGG